MILKRSLSSLSNDDGLTMEEVDASFWPSPSSVLVPKFIRHVQSKRYAEPCAGNGALIKHLQAYAKCVYACDLLPRHNAVSHGNAFATTRETIGCDMVVTNPPFDAKFVYPFIDHCIHMVSVTWLFLPLQFATRATSAFVMPFCERFVAVGPVKFIEDSPSKGETNFAWFKFVPRRTSTIFEALDATYNSRKVPDRLKVKMQEQT